MEKEDEKTIMVVEVTAGTLRNIRSSGVYANLSGHAVDYIAFLSHQGTFIASVNRIEKNLPLNKIYSNAESKAKTTCYRIGTLSKHKLRRNSKIPRGRKRITNYEKFLNASSTSDLFRSRY